MRVIIQQVDMDSCLTGLILGVSAADQLEVVRGGASPEDLANPAALCIEAGGSGHGHLGNYDHHEAGGPSASACRQAWDVHGMNRVAGFTIRGGHAAVERLVLYVEIVDTAGPTDLPPVASPVESRPPAPGFPTLSALFSGMRLYLRDRPVDQFLGGLAILQVVLEEGLDPFGLMPERPEWRDFLNAKRRNTEGIAQAKAHAEVFAARSGRSVGFLQTDFIGALGALYALGCEIAIAYSPRYDPPSGGDPVPKYSISGRNGLRVDRLLPHLNALEPGWGGPAHGTIIASPRVGSWLFPREVTRVVVEYA
jgi:hypothetical protein